MDLLKKLTGKNPDEYENAAKSLVENSDTELFAKLVKQDDFLFDFVKNNVANRIKNVCNKDNYLNLMKFLDFYSPSYDTVIAETLYNFGGIELLPAMKEIFINGENGKKAYAAKYFSYVPKEYLYELLPAIRKTAESEFEPLSANSIDILSNMKDDEFKNKALKMLNSNDEFEQYSGVKYLVSYKAVEVLPEIIEVMEVGCIPALPRIMVMLHCRDIPDPIRLSVPPFAYPDRAIYKRSSHKHSPENDERKV